MDWYYAGGEKPVGPISEAQFDQLVRAGTIRPETLVWNAGMKDWQPLQSLPPRPATGSVPPVVGMLCAECRQTFPTTEMVQLGGTWICARCKPVFLQRLVEGAPQPTSATVWRDGKSLVAAAGVSLPACCARCNGAVSKPPIKRTLYWHQSWIYLLILLSILIYIIVAIIVRKKAVAYIPLCDAHRRQRWMFIAVSWVLALLGPVVMVIALGSVNPSGWEELLGLIIFVAGTVLGLWKGRLVATRKIDGDKVWINGFCREYLDGLPEWRG